MECIYPIISVVGMAGAGKTTVVDYLIHNGWSGICFGKVIINELTNRNLEANECNERMIRDKLKKEYGLGYCAKILLPEISNSSIKYPVVIDNLCSWSEYKYLKSVFPKMYVLCISANKNIRYDRISRRNYRSLSFEQIMQRDISEIENLEKAGPIAHADYIILNNFGYEKLMMDVDLIIEDILNINK